jgi:hypothetical protein
MLRLIDVSKTILLPHFIPPPLFFVEKFVRNELGGIVAMNNLAKPRHATSNRHSLASALSAISMLPNVQATM